MLPFWLPCKTCTLLSIVAHQSWEHRIRISSVVVHAGCIAHKGTFPPSSRHVHRNLFPKILALLYICAKETCQLPSNTCFNLQLQVLTCCDFEWAGSQLFPQAHPEWYALLFHTHLHYVFPPSSRQLNAATLSIVTLCDYSHLPEVGMTYCMHASPTLYMYSQPFLHCRCG